MLWTVAQSKESKNTHLKNQNIYTTQKELFICIL